MLTLVGAVVKEGDRIAQLVLERVSAYFSSVVSSGNSYGGEGTRLSELGEDGC